MSVLGYLSLCLPPLLKVNFFPVINTFQSIPGRVLRKVLWVNGDQYEKQQRSHQRISIMAAVRVHVSLPWFSLHCPIFRINTFKFHQQMDILFLGLARSSQKHCGELNMKPTFILLGVCVNRCRDSPSPGLWDWQPCPGEAVTGKVGSKEEGGVFFKVGSWVDSELRRMSTEG